VIIHASHGLHCCRQCFNSFGTGGDSGLPCIYPVEQVVCPPGKHVLIEAVLIVTHKHAGSMRHYNGVLLGVKVFDFGDNSLTLEGISLVFLSFPWTKLLRCSHTSAKNSV
jgi:hypothetical protein